MKTFFPTKTQFISLEMSDEQFTIKLRLIDGSEQTVTGHSNMTVGTLRAVIVAKLALPDVNTNHIRIIHLGRVLDDDSKALAAYNITPETSTLHVIIRPRTASIPDSSGANGAAGHASVNSNFSFSTASPHVGVIHVTSMGGPLSINEGGTSILPIPPQLAQGLANGSLGGNDNNPGVDFGNIFARHVLSNLAAGNAFISPQSQSPQAPNAFQHRQAQWQVSSEQPIPPVPPTAPAPPLNSAPDTAPASGPAVGFGDLLARHILSEIVSAVVPATSPAQGTGTVPILAPAPAVISSAAATAAAVSVPAADAVLPAPPRPVAHPTPAPAGDTTASASGIPSSAAHTTHSNARIAGMRGPMSSPVLGGINSARSSAINAAPFLLSTVESALAVLRYARQALPRSPSATPLADLSNLNVQTQPAEALATVLVELNNLMGELSLPLLRMSNQLREHAATLSFPNTTQHRVEIQSEMHNLMGLVSQLSQAAQLVSTALSGVRFMPPQTPQVIFSQPQIVFGQTAD